MNVSAKDTATGNEQKITITASTKLDEATKSRIMKEGEQFAQQDRIKKEEAETRNNADTLLYTIEKTKKDFADKIKKEDVERLDKAASDLRTALSGTDFAVIKASMDSLSKLVQEVGSGMYQKSTAQPK